MGNCEERLVSKPQEEAEKSSFSPAPDPDPAPASDLGTIAENLVDDLRTLGLYDDDSWELNDNENQNENPEGDSVVKEGKSRRSQYPLRPDEPDCSFYLRTGNCRYGSNCRFNHPIGRKKQARSLSESSESVEVAVKEKEKEYEEYPERAGLPECKYYLRTGGCKFGKACRYHHPREKTVVEPPLELNFLGLPIRPGERECPFYMRTGSCKFATDCRFHHPDPTAVGGSDPPSGYQNGGSVPLNSSGASQPAVTSWTLPGAPVPYYDSSPSYVPVMFSPPQPMHPNWEWDGYQEPVSSLHPPEGSMYPSLVSVMNNSTQNADGSTHQLKHVEEFPERPGQRECKYFMKTGDCKYRSACRFHHPKNRIPKSPVLSPIESPLRPDQTICSHYSRYGICKFGSAF